jgi:methyl-accepting chemotaxis protein
VLVQMVPTINKTSELVQEISAASSEQTSGVNQITTAMSHLNSATQQNASASEQLSATAEELSGQAAQLQDMMAFFQLEAGSRRTADTSHSAATKLRQTSHQPPRSPTRRAAQGTSPSVESSQPRRGHQAISWNRQQAAESVDEASFSSF